MAFQVLDTQGRIKGAQTPSEFSLTTTGNIDNLDFLDADIIRFNNATLSTLRGLKAGYAGQRVTVVSIGAGEVDLAHQNANSTAANRLLNFVTGGITPLAAGVGACVYQYDGTTLRWRLVSHEQGKPINVAYDAGNFTASTGLWTVDSGDQVTYTYLIAGRTLTVVIFIGDSDVSATPSFLWTTIPNGYVAVASQRSVCAMSDAGTANQAGFLTSSAAESKVYWFKFVGAWTLTVADNTAVYGSITFEVT